jgi:hypothetical protein
VPLIRTIPLLALVLAGFCGSASGAIIALDDVYGTLTETDDGSTCPVSLNGNVGPIKYLTADYDKVYVNNNGNLTFGFSNSSFTQLGIIGDTTLPIIAPFYADVDTRYGGGTVSYGKTTFNGRQAFGVTWDDVEGYNLASNFKNSFQVLLVNRSDVGQGDFDIVFNYDKIQWDTGGMSNCIAALVGFGNGSGQPGTSYQLPGSASTTGAFLDGGDGATALIHNQLNSDRNGRYIFEIRNGFPPDPGVVPEPASLTLWALGAIGGMFAARRRLRRRAS